MKRLIVATFAVLMIATAALAQSAQFGRLVGTISSADGVIAGATVVIKSNQTGKEITVTTSGEGTFSVPALDPGLYTVTVTSTGFKTLTVNELKIDVGRDYSFNQTLEVGDVSASVTVTAGTEIVNSTSGELSTTVSPRQVLELPLNGRNPLGLVGLQAGAAPNRGNGSEIINGGKTASTDFTRDGINVQDVFIRNGFVPDTPTVDNTGEFTVSTLNSGPEQGFGESHIQLVTPRGGRDFHGALFLYNRNSRFAANTFFNNAAGRFVATDTAVIQGRANVGDPRLPKPFLNRNQFGGKISGPIPIPYWNGVVRNKAFFFFSTEKYILHQQTPKTTTIFLPLARQGIFSYRPTNPAAVVAGQCITFTGGVCTVNMLNGLGMTGPLPPADPVGTHQLGVLPLDTQIQSRFIARIPTQGNRNDIGDQLNTTGYGFNQSDPEDRREYTGRVDVELTSQHSLNGVYRFNETVDARTDIDTTYNPVAQANTDAPVKFMALAWNWTPTSLLTNEVRGGFQFAPVTFNNLVLPQESKLLASLSLATMPEVLFRNQGRNTKTFNVQDNATYLWGNHSLRFGGTWQQYKVRSFNFANVGIPTYAISTTANGNTAGLAAGLFPGGISTANLATANVLRYLMGGVIGSGSIAANVTDRNSGFVPGARLDRNLKYTNIAFYVGDQWRVNNRLTLNLGLRYELYTPLRSTDGLYLEPVLNPADPVASILDPNGTYDFVGRNSGHSGNFVKLDKNNFAPIVSFAYSTGFNNGVMKMLFGAPGKTVFRGGFRLGYVNDEYIRSIDNAVGQNAGLTTTASARQGGVFAGTTFLNDRFSGALQPTVAPPFITPPITYAFNNVNATNFGTTFGVDPNLQVQREYEFNIGIQRELPGQMALEARYVGGWTNDMVRTIDYNQVDITNNGFGNDYLRAFSNFAISGSIAGNAACLGNGTCKPLTVIPNLTAAGQTSVTANVQASGAFYGLPADLALNLVQNGRAGTVKIMPNPSTGVGNLVVNAGMQRYNALQVELRRRFAAGLYFQANYTFQKILTDVTDDGINQTRVAPYLDNNNKGIDYARASFDTAQFFNFNTIYELPFGKGKRFLNEGTWMNRLVGGWQITSIVQINTGAPISITDARGTLNRVGRSANQTAFSNLTKDQIKALIGYRNVNGVLWYIDPSVTSVNGTAANGFGSAAFPGQVFFNVGPNATGNMERFFITGPTVWNWDAGLIKNISITEKTRLQLRAEAFNVTNSTRFGTPTFAVGSANFGKLTSAFSSRVMQFVGRFEF
jgi:hypothetical protein